MGMCQQLARTDVLLFSYEILFLNINLDFGSLVTECENHQAICPEKPFVCSVRKDFTFYALKRFLSFLTFLRDLNPDGNC